MVHGGFGKTLAKRRGFNMDFSKEFEKKFDVSSKFTCYYIYFYHPFKEVTILVNAQMMHGSKFADEKFLLKIVFDDAKLRSSFKGLEKNEWHQMPQSEFFDYLEKIASKAFEYNYYQFDAGTETKLYRNDDEEVLIKTRFFKSTPVYAKVQSTSKTIKNIISGIEKSKSFNLSKDSDNNRSTLYVLPKEKGTLQIPMRQIESKIKEMGLR
jgi:hypothetical protein